MCSLVLGFFISKRRLANLVVLHRPQLIFLHTALRSLEEGGVIGGSIEGISARRTWDFIVWNGVHWLKGEVIGGPVHDVHAFCWVI